jgi:hypothetical protein
MQILTQVEAKKESDSLSWLKEIDRRIKIVDYFMKSRSESFCAKPRDRDEVEVATGRSIKTPSIQNEIYDFIFKRITKKNQT